MDLNDYLKTASSEELQAKLEEIRANRRKRPEKKERAVKQKLNLSKQVIDVDSEEMQQLLEDF